MSHHYSGPDFGFPLGNAQLDFTDLYAFPKPGDSEKSILIMNVHPSAGESPPGPTTIEPFAPAAMYELKIDTDGDAVADIAYQVRFSPSGDGAQTATVRRVDGAQAADSAAGEEVGAGGRGISPRSAAERADRDAQARCRGCDREAGGSGAIGAIAAIGGGESGDVAVRNPRAIGATNRGSA